MNPSTAIVIAGVAADAWLLVFVAIRGRRHWLQATFTACALAYLVLATSFVGIQEGFLASTSVDFVPGVMALAHALTAILVLGLIHGEALPRRRSAAFLLLLPVPFLGYLGPIQGWTAATAYDGNALGGFLVLCLGIPLAETIYARYTSRLLAPHAFWLSLGLVSLVVAGPVYTYELELLNQPLLGGANIAAPIALACFALVAVRTDPFPIIPHVSIRGAQPGSLPHADAIVFDERRPKYAVRAAREEPSHGRDTVYIGRTPPPTAVETRFAAIVPGRYAAIRALTTASEFLAWSPQGLVVLDGLADLSALSGWSPALEAAVRLRHLAIRTKSTVILCSARLTDEERRALRELRCPWWTLPDPAPEIEAILAQSFGAGAARLLDSFCRSHGLRRDDVTADHVPALLAFLARALSELSDAIAGGAGHGLRTLLESGADALRSFAAQAPETLARGTWPSREASAGTPELVVTAAEYWKGKEMEELFAAADAMGDQETWFEKARSVFVEQLGDAGESVLRSQLARMGKKPEDLDKRDLGRIADRASVDLRSLAEVVDIPQERDRIQGQIESIRRRLEVIVEGDK